MGKEEKKKIILNTNFKRGRSPHKPTRSHKDEKKYDRQRDKKKIEQTVGKKTRIVPMRKFKTLGPVKDKRIMVRCNFDVAVKNGEVLPKAAWRIDATIPFLEELAYQQAKVIAISHRGRPHGEDKTLSLRPVYEYIAEHTEANVFFGTKEPKSGEIVVYENLRFNPGETANDETFALELARDADIYINNDFATAHRAHASIVLLPRLLPSAAGPLLTSEIEELTAIRDYMGAGLVFAMGGAKAGTKINLIEKFLDRTDGLLIGGVLANTLLLKKGYEVGRSVVDEDVDISGIDLESEELILPTDVIVSTVLERAENKAVKSIDEVTGEDIIVDVGPDTVKLFKKHATRAKTAVWNGPLGFVETQVFRTGSQQFAQTFAGLDAKTVVGGGDIVTFLAEENFLEGVNHVSTGGGSMLAFLAGKKLPALNALTENE